MSAAGISALTRKSPTRSSASRIVEKTSVATSDAIPEPGPPVAIHVVGPKILRPGKRQTHDQNCWQHLERFRPSTIVRTSQNGTMAAVNGKMRPSIAFRSDSDSAVTAASVCTGVPMAPQATGAVLAIRFNTAAWMGSNPNPIMNARQWPPARRSRPHPRYECAEAKRDQQSCNRRSGVMAATDCFADLELAGFNRNVVEKNSGDDDPNNFQQSE
jgi:hypothetical protein